MTDVLSALQKHWPSPAYAWLFEVQDATGGRARRRADALVCSCWPSNGIWLAGVELKVSRSDWKRELKDPGKAWGVGRYCHYWWLACPAGVAEEVPEAWGLVTVDDKGTVRVRKQAPRREPEPLTFDFLASVMRNTEALVDGRINDAVSRARQETREQLGTEALERQVKQLSAEKDDLEIKRGREARRAETLLDRERRCNRAIETFCEATGLSTEAFYHGIYSDRPRMLAVAETLMGHRLPMLAEKFELLAKSLRDAAAMGNPPRLEVKATGEPCNSSKATES